MINDEPTVCTGSPVGAITTGMDQAVYDECVNVVDYACQ